MTDKQDGVSYQPTPWPDAPAPGWEGGGLPSRAARRAAAQQAAEVVAPSVPAAQYVTESSAGVASAPIVEAVVEPMMESTAPIAAVAVPRRVSVASVVQSPVTPAPVAPAAVAPAAVAPQVVQTPQPQQVSPAFPAWQPTNPQPQQFGQANYPPAFPGSQRFGGAQSSFDQVLTPVGNPNGQYPDDEPEPKKRRTWIPVLVTLVLFAGLAAFALQTVGGVRDWWSNYTAPSAGAADFEPGTEGEPIMVTIPSGATGTRMGELLAEAGVVASQQAFVEAFRNNPRATSIAPGTYELQTHMAAADVVNAMLSGGIVQTRLVIPEGFTKEQVFARMESTLGFTRDEIDAALADPEALNLPEVAEGNPEGWLFPATYNIQPNETAADVLRAMINRTRQELVAQGADASEWEIILNKAALIEREVRDPDDLPKVARAIQNRIDRGINLQIDAAVAYGLGISGTQLTRAHLADPSNPFNTYQHPGLPPTPIANPGAAAIRAALNPADGDWIFWVTINLATGETIFTNTYAEHQVYVAQLRQWQRDNPGFGQPGFVPGENLTG